MGDRDEKYISSIIANPGQTLKCLNAIIAKRENAVVLRLGIVAKASSIMHASVEEGLTSILAINDYIKVNLVEGFSVNTYPFKASLRED